MIDAYFSPKGILLQQEGELIHSSLKNGLLVIQGTNIDSKGDYYLAFLMLSTGLERLMKVTIIVDHMASNELNAPNSSLIRNYGHDLNDLFKKCSLLATQYQVSEFTDLSSCEIDRDIVGFLSDFARRTRYHNLDSIAGGKVLNDPLSEWYRIIERIAESDIPKGERLRAELKGRALGNLFAQNSILIFHDLNQKLAPPDDLSASVNLIALAVPYCIARLFAIIVSLDELLRVIIAVAQSVDKSLGNTVSSIPFMSEFLEFARYPDPDIWQLPVRRH